MGEIRWTEKASNNLHAIYDYIAQDSKIYAARFIKSLIKATLKLESLPYSGRIVPEFESYRFREVIYQNYRIVYRFSENKGYVEILAVIHSARDMKTVLHQDWELI